MIYLDTETTGLCAGFDEIVQIGIVDDAGKVLLDTLVRPIHRKKWPEAEAIHGITPEDVAGASMLDDLLPVLTEILRGQKVVIYNADFDSSFLPIIRKVAESVECCMLRFAEWYADWDEWHGNYRWQSLGTAAYCAGHHLDQAHNAVADALACRAVWRFVADPAEQERVRLEREAEQERARAWAPINEWLEKVAAEKGQQETIVQKAATAVLWQRLQLRPLTPPSHRWCSLDDEPRPMDADDYALLFFGQSLDSIRHEEWLQTPAGKRRTQLNARKETLKANTTHAPGATERFIRKAEWPEGGMTETQILKARREGEPWVCVGYALSGGSKRSRFEYWVYVRAESRPLAVEEVEIPTAKARAARKPKKQQERHA